MKSGVVAVAIVLVVILIFGVYFVLQNSGDEVALRINLASETQNNLNEQETTTQPGETNGEEVQNNPQTYDVEISGFSFQPQELRIKQNDVVVWTNQDSTMHTVTSDSGSELASNSLSRGQSYSNTFTEKGTFEYHCTPHPYMKGKIIVE